ncbi:MAG: sensor histidine kinase [Lachnospirales bacterium]
MKKILANFFNGNASLKDIYFRSFFALIVIPILLVFIFALFIVKDFLRTSAISNIESMQDKMISSLNEDIKGYSLQLSHLVYANDSELMELASKTDTDNIGEKNYYMRRFEESFKMAMISRQEVISCTMFMKSGTNTYVKDRIVIPNEIIKNEFWYKNALENKNIVEIGSYDTSLDEVAVGLKGREFVLVLSLSPDETLDKNENIEMISMIVQTKVAKMLKENNKNLEFGTTVIINEDNNIIYGSTVDENVTTLVNQMDKSVGVHTGKFDNKSMISKEKYTYLVSKVPDSNWRMITYVDDSYLTIKFNTIAFITICVIISLFVLFTIFSRYFLKNIISPVYSIVEGFKEVENYNLDVYVEPTGQSEIANMIKSFNYMTKNLQLNIKEKDEAKSREHSAEMKALQSQINPHFLINTLNSIRFMAQVSKYTGIRKMAEALINILSNSFRENVNLYTVREEIELLNSYIYLMKIRYSNGFDVSFDVDDICQEYYIPRLILQPVIENSIVHGFNQSEDIGNISISICEKITIKENKTFLYIRVRDDGKGMSKRKIEEIFTNIQRDKEDSYSIGISNVYNRLKLRFGDSCEFKIESIKGEYTETLIKLPILKGDKDEESSDS